MRRSTRVSRLCFNTPCRRGVSACELVILLPLLIAFAILSADFGRFAYVAIAMDNAVRVGAEYGATRSFTTRTRQAWEDEVKNRTLEELSDVKSGWLTNLNVIVSTSTTANDLARVDVSAKGNFSTIVDWPFLSDQSIRREFSIRQYR
jgi:Flp pilus assembly protein TadG